MRGSILALSMVIRAVLALQSLNSAIGSTYHGSSYRSGNREEFLPAAALTKLSCDHSMNSFNGPLVVPSSSAIKENNKISIVKETICYSGASAQKWIRYLFNSLSAPGWVDWNEFYRTNDPIVLLSTSSQAQVPVQPAAPTDYGPALNLAYRIVANLRFHSLWCRYHFLQLGTLLILGSGALRLGRARFRLAIQQKLVANAALITTRVIKETLAFNRENRALKDAINNMSLDRDSLQAQVSRLTFERDNFKESLQKAIRRPRELGNAQSRVREEPSDVLGALADREWRLKQQLEKALAERTRLAADVAQSQAQVAQLSSELTSAHHRFEVEMQENTTLRTERDLYLNFAKYSSAQKKHMVQILADSTDRREYEGRRLDRRIMKVRASIEAIDSKIADRLSAQQSLVLSISGITHTLQTETACACSFSDVQRKLEVFTLQFHTLCQSMAAGLEAQRREVECGLCKIYTLSEQLAAFIAAASRAPIQKDGAASWAASLGDK